MSTQPRYEQRKLLEQLMGRDALTKAINPSQYSSGKNSSDIHDSRVCKAYIIGHCPYDLFNGTKSSFGRCPKIHSTKYKLQYEREGKRYPEFEEEYFNILNDVLQDVNAKIKVALRRLEHTEEEQAKISEATKDLDLIDTKIGLYLQEIETLFDVGEISKAQMEMVKLQELRDARKAVAQRVLELTENVGQAAQQKLQVCDKCGAYLSRLDTDRRLADHFIGKVHLGYVTMRAELEELKRKRRNGL